MPEYEDFLHRSLIEQLDARQKRQQIAAARRIDKPPLRVQLLCLLGGAMWLSCAAAPNRDAPNYLFARMAGLMLERRRENNEITNDNETGIEPAPPQPMSAHHPVAAQLG